MASTAAERKRRQRAHERGDHSACLTSRCAAKASAALDAVTIPAAPAGLEPPTGEPRFGQVTEATMAWLSTFDWPDGDPRRVTEAVLLDLAVAWDERHEPTVGSLIAKITHNIATYGGGEASSLDEVRSRYFAQHAELLNRTRLTALRGGATDG